MDDKRHDLWRATTLTAMALGFGILAACGGGTGNPTDSGTSKTYLSVQASDADGDALHYQWRVTAGTIENRDSPQTVWTMPDGPGLHFAYVTVSDGKGGYVEQQYAASSDALGTDVAARPTITRVAPTVTTTAQSAGRLRMVSPDKLEFTSSATSAKAQRTVYLPDVQVQIVPGGGGTPVFSGATDLSGELSLPDLAPGSYEVRCTTVPGAPLAPCDAFGTLAVSLTATVQLHEAPLTLATARNLRLFGHIALADGGACGTQSEFFALQTAATVQLLAADGSALAPPTRVNRFGDYAIDAAVLAGGRYALAVTCEGYAKTLDVPASTDPNGYVYTLPIELSHSIPNARPAIAKMVANGADGNVRGQMIVADPGVSTSLPGWSQFLAYKGFDTRLSACRYYLSLGAVGGCDPQGAMQDAITFDDWKRQHRFAPYLAGNTEVAATYVNRMDLNLVRRMVATQVADDHVAFYVCNHPGPVGQSQAEVDAVVDTGLSDQKRVACVAMEWTTVPGVNGGKPFTKFLTFGPDGGLLPSINLDGRGEKYMPGACVACHGGTKYNGRFAERGTPSPYLGSGFLPFDTGNYLFSSRGGYSEAAQSQAIHDLNMLVRATDYMGEYPATTRLIEGWYKNGTTLDKQYVPKVWSDAEANGKTGAQTFYREVVGGVCRTCHSSMGSFRFDWDSNVDAVTNPGGLANKHFCGGSDDLAVNASMPNALASRDRLADRIKADPALAALMRIYLGCETPAPDPGYARR
jgi:mono/diheme cytochrome c family protein